MRIFLFLPAFPNVIRLDIEASVAYLRFLCSVNFVVNLSFTHSHVFSLRCCLKFGLKSHFIDFRLHSLDSFTRAEFEEWITYNNGSDVSVSWETHAV